MEKISIYLTQTLIVMQMNRREVIEMKRLVKSQSESVKPVPRIFLFTLTWDAFRWRCVFFAMLFSSRFLNKIKCLAIGKCFENYIYGGTGQGW